jgi:hypothetical protein
LPACVTCHSLLILFCKVLEHILRSKQTDGKKITEDTYTRLCHALTVMVHVLPGEKRLTKVAYITALVNRLFNSESELARKSIIENLKGVDRDKGVPKDVADCLDEQDKKDFKCSDDAGPLAADNSDLTPEAIKALRPPGAVICAMSSRINCFEGVHRGYNPRRWVSRRWGGPIANRTELVALTEVVRQLWVWHGMAGLSTDDNSEPSRDDISRALADLHRPVQAVAADVPIEGKGGKGRGRGGRARAVPRARGRR